MKYTNESISQLKGAERVRKRPAVIFGSDGIEGVQHSFFEILSNSIDEARAGYGKEIEIIRHTDHSITVIDHGRGIPVDYNQRENRYNWELLFTELYAGGKYESETYKFSLGLNGLGLCATQYASEYMDVEVIRDGHLYELHFEKGEMTEGGFKKSPCAMETGTKITWRADLEVFKSVEISIDYFKDVVHRQAIVNPGVTFVLKDEETSEAYEYFYARGIKDYLSEEIPESQRISDIVYFESEGRGRDRADLDEYEVKIHIAFVFSNEKNIFDYYHNSSYLEHGGSPDKAVRNAFTYELERLLKDGGKYVKNEKKINFTDVEDSLSIVISSFSTQTSYENQTKKAINNKFIYDFISDELKKKLEVYFIENRDFAEKIANQVLINKRSREKAESTRLSLKKTLSQKIDVTNRIKKFVDCRSKDRNIKELYILEGDSALGSCKLARNSEFQALMPVRGKILNCLKADYDKIFKNEIIMDLLKVIGAGVEIKSKHNTELDSFNLEALRWNKVIICTDADVDGFQIRALILAMFYRLCPTLIEEGKIYIAETPLYEIVDAKQKSYFAFNEQEKVQILSEMKGKYTIQRSKGLGENDPDMMWETTMCPDSRRLIRVCAADVENTERIFKVLLGDELTARKKYIEEYGADYLEKLDVS
ncbi:MAG: toprim domain-containing protein [Bacillota bacterium]|nr:toprim domain-containing protein [Bacillota bacterium]